MADFQIGEIVTRNHRTCRTIPTEWSGRRVASLKPASPTKTARQDDVLLRRSGLSWFVIAAIGQAAFIWMIVVHYWVKTLSGDAVGWNEKPLIKGHVSGDEVGNVMFAVHVVLAAVITLGGLMQLLPAIRQRMPMLHRWNGRLFFVVAVVMALGGLWLTWGRGTYLSIVSGVSVSINGLLILLFATLAWRMALKRDFDSHRHWALRAFLVVNGVWFLRVGLMAWILMSGGGVGMNRTHLAQQTSCFNLVPI